MFLKEPGTPLWLAVVLHLESYGELQDRASKLRDEMGGINRTIATLKEQGSGPAAPAFDAAVEQLGKTVLELEARLNETNRKIAEIQKDLFSWFSPRGMSATLSMLRQTRLWYEMEHHTEGRLVYVPGYERTINKEWLKSGYFHIDGCASAGRKNYNKWPA